MNYKPLLIGKDPDDAYHAPRLLEKPGKLRRRANGKK